MKKLTTHYYKKDTLDQLKTFCTVVECGGSINNAAKKLNVAASGVSMKIKSLEHDLKKDLFDRKSKKLALNDNGRAFYAESIDIINKIDLLFDKEIKARSGKIKIFWNTIKNRLTNKYYRCRLFLINKLRKMLIKITFERFFITLLISILVLLTYLYQTNWFFDRKLKKLANPLLREVMEWGQYRIRKDIHCQENIYATVFCMDINKLLLTLSKHKYSYSVNMMKITELPSTPMRLSDDHIANEIFNNDKEITCDRERRFNWLKERHDNKLQLLRANSEARFYLFFTKAGGTNYNVLLDNVQKHKNQIFPIKIDSSISLNNGTYWMIKYRSYYYLIFETNGVSSHNQHEKGERYLIFKKLTLKELMTYDNGSYWKIIKEYNIKIDK